MIRCYIANREGVFRHLPRLAGRIDWVQVRQKDLGAKALFALTRQAMGSGVKVIVNSRLDVALAVGAAGVHLPADSPPPSRLRPVVGAGMLIGVSCHSIGDVERAEAEGADYALLSPVFDSPSKPGYGPALGLEILAQACSRVRIPVLALGGVDESTAGGCMAAGAAGFAAVTGFEG